MSEQRDEEIFDMLVDAMAEIMDNNKKLQKLSKPDVIHINDKIICEIKDRNNYLESLKEMFTNLLGKEGQND